MRLIIIGILLFFLPSCKTASKIESEQARQGSIKSYEALSDSTTTSVDDNLMRSILEQIESFRSKETEMKIKVYDTSVTDSSGQSPLMIEAEVTTKEKESSSAQKSDSTSQNVITENISVSDYLSERDSTYKEDTLTAAETKSDVGNGMFSKLTVIAICVAIAILIWKGSSIINAIKKWN